MSGAQLPAGVTGRFSRRSHSPYRGGAGQVERDAAAGEAAIASSYSASSLNQQGARALRSERPLGPARPGAFAQAAERRAGLVRAPAADAASTSSTRADP